jgi:hypothetical protein
VDARTGDTVSPILETWALAIAREDFSGPDSGAAAFFIGQDAPIEYRGTLPVWQIQFHDPGNSRIYVHALTGKVVARRNDIWRLYDFLWSLHIMDYRTREDFNHPLLIGAALAAFCLCLTGLVLVALRFWPRGARRT